MIDMRINMRIKIVLVAVVLVFVISGLSFRNVSANSDQCPDGWASKIEAPNPIIHGPTVTFSQPMIFCVKAGEKNSGIITGSTFTVTWLTDGGQTPDISHVVTYYPTAVTLINFTVKYTRNARLLSWETVSEADNIGFNIYKSRTVNSPLLKQNKTLIPSAQPGSPSGSVYTFTDKIPRFGIYWLEALDIYGGSKLFQADMVR